MIIHKIHNFHLRREFLQCLESVGERFFMMMTLENIRSFYVSLKMSSSTIRCMEGLVIMAQEKLVAERLRKVQTFLFLSKVL